MNPIPIFNQEEPEINYDNLCPICRVEDMDENNSYIINECNHKFHTECLIQWFRTDHSNCPMCNGFQEPEKIPYIVKPSMFKLIVDFSRRKKAPKQLKKMIEKYKKSKDKSVLSARKFSQFKRENKKILSQFKKLRQEKWMYFRKSMKIKREISSIPIEPLRINLKPPRNNSGRSIRVSLMNN